MVLDYCFVYWDLPLAVGGQGKKRAYKWDTFCFPLCLIFLDDESEDVIFVR